MTNADYDIAVIGAGVAGLTAAKAAAVEGLRVVLIDRLGVGGQVSTIEEIDNFPLPGYPTAGYELGAQLLEEAEEQGVEVLLDEVSGLTHDSGIFTLQLLGQSLTASAVILATGSALRKLGVRGEEDFAGNGVSHCASCDGPLFRDRRIVVVGGGDSAFDEANVLARFGDEVTIVHSGNGPTAREPSVRRALSNKNIGTIPASTVTEISGGAKVSGVTITNLETGESGTRPADAVFVYIGLTANTGLAEGLSEFSSEQRIITDTNLMTVTPGLFAAGDLRDGCSPLLPDVLADGLTAGHSAGTYLRSRAAQLSN